MLLVIENLQPAEIVCARHPEVAVLYTAGQFGSDTLDVLRTLAASRWTVAILDADLGGVRIARRIREAAPHAEIVDVGAWPHPRQPPYAVGSTRVKALRALASDPVVGWFAAAILDRGYPVEQEMATLEIVDAALTAAIEG